MDHPRPVGIVQRIGDVFQDWHNFIEWDLSRLFEQGRKVHAVKIFHHHKVEFVFHPIIKNPDDVGMFQPGQGLRLTLKAFAELFFFGQICEQDFDGNDPLAGRVFGAIDFCHAAFTDQCQVGVMGKEDRRLGDRIAALVTVFYPGRRLEIINVDVIEGAVHKALKRLSRGLEKGACRNCRNGQANGGLLA